MSKEKRRVLHRGELLAVARDVVKSDDRGDFFWLLGPPSYANERVGSVIVVRICGPLDYHDEGCGDSYECIVKRIEDAFAGRCGDDEGEKPSAVVLKIDSPGGVVAGLHESIKRVRSMRKDAGIPLIAYVDETAYSAAYAWCCACDEVFLPKSGFCGSIGVISTLVDQTAADKKMGLRFVILTSGARKADGHVHAPITDDMVEEERPRVEELATQFFEDVRVARGIDLDTIRSFEAKRFLGQEAVDAGVADGVMGWSELLADLEAVAQSDSTPLAQPGTPVSSSRGRDRIRESRAQGKNMLVLNALIARTQSAMKTEKDPTKLLALAGQLEAFKKTKTHIEKHETEEGEDEGDDEESEESSASEEEQEESAEGDETDRHEDDPDDEGDDPDDDEEDDEDEAEESSEESEEEAAKSAASAIVRASGLTTKSGRRALHKAATVMIVKTVRSSAAHRVFAAASKITGKKGATAIVAALQGNKEAATKLKRDVAEIKADRQRERKASLIENARTAGRITPAEAKSLVGKKLSFVESYLDMRPASTVRRPQDAASPPAVRGNGQPAPISAQDPVVQKELKRAMAAVKAQGLKLDEGDLLKALESNGARVKFPEV